MYDRIFAAGGSYRGPTNWYKARFGLRLGVQEEKDDNLDPHIPCPALFVEQAESSIVHMAGLSEQTAQFAESCVNRRVGTRGHWVQLQSKDEVNRMLEEFLESVRET